MLQPLTVEGLEYVGLNFIFAASELNDAMNQVLGVGKKGIRADGKLVQAQREPRASSLSEENR